MYKEEKKKTDEDEKTDVRTEENTDTDREDKENRNRKKKVQKLEDPEGESILQKLSQNEAKIKIRGLMPLKNQQKKLKTKKTTKKSIKLENINKKQACLSKQKEISPEEEYTPLGMNTAIEKRGYMPQTKPQQKI